MPMHTPIKKLLLISTVTQCVAAARHDIIGGQKSGRLRECRAVLAEQRQTRCDPDRVSFHDTP
jgi:hypothetical protein